MIRKYLLLLYKNSLHIIIKTIKQVSENSTNFIIHSTPGRIDREHFLDLMGEREHDIVGLLEHLVEHRVARVRTKPGRHVEQSQAHAVLAAALERQAAFFVAGSFRLTHEIVEPVVVVHKRVVDWPVVVHATCTNRLVEIPYFKKNSKIPQNI